jgi:hypothetical protein
MPTRWIIPFENFRSCTALGADADRRQRRHPRLAVRRTVAEQRAKYVKLLGREVVEARVLRR